MTNLLHKAYEIAEKEDVSTLPDRAVVYSVSYMPDSENKKRAEDFVKSTPDARMLTIRRAAGRLSPLVWTAELMR